MITPMFGEHVTGAHAGTRHVSHEEHAPLAYFASRSLPRLLTPAPCFSTTSLFPFFFSILFVSLAQFLSLSLSLVSPPPSSNIHSALIRSYFASSILSLSTAISSFILFSQIVISARFGRSIIRGRF